MQQKIKYLVIIFLLFLASCSKIEIINAPIQKDSLIMYKPRPPKPIKDTTLYSISFDAFVEEWDDGTI